MRFGGVLVLLGLMLLGVSIWWGGIRMLLTGVYLIGMGGLISSIIRGARNIDENDGGG